MSTCLVAVSNFSTRFISPSNSFSVVVTINWLVRASGITWLRAERVGFTRVTMLVGSLYLSWMVLETSGSSALWAFVVMRAILAFGFFTKARLVLSSTG